jgi:hypothetical protein
VPEPDWALVPAQPTQGLNTNTNTTTTTNNNNNNNVLVIIHSSSGILSEKMEMVLRGSPNATYVEM